MDSQPLAYTIEELLASDTGSASLAVSAIEYPEPVGIRAQRHRRSIAVLRWMARRQQATQKTAAVSKPASPCRVKQPKEFE